MTTDIKLPFDLGTIFIAFFMSWIYIGHILLIASIIDPNGGNIIKFGGFLVILPIIISNMVYESKDWYLIMYPYWRIAKALKVMGKHIKDIIPYRIHMSDWDEGKQ